jgi:hypothetical protein
MDAALANQIIILIFLAFVRILGAHLAMEHFSTPIYAPEAKIFFRRFFYLLLALSGGFLLDIRFITATHVHRSSVLWHSSPRHRIAIADFQSAYRALLELRCAFRAGVNVSALPADVTRLRATSHTIIERVPGFSGPNGGLE